MATRKRRAHTQTQQPTIIGDQMHWSWSGTLLALVSCFVLFLDTAQYHAQRSHYFSGLLCPFRIQSDLPVFQNLSPIVPLLLVLMLWVTWFSYSTNMRSAGTPFAAPRRWRSAFTAKRSEPYPD